LSSKSTCPTETLCSGPKYRVLRGSTLVTFGTATHPAAPPVTGRRTCRVSICSGLHSDRDFSVVGTQKYSRLHMELVTRKEFLTTESKPRVAHANLHDTLTFANLTTQASLHKARATCEPRRGQTSPKTKYTTETTINRRGSAMPGLPLTMVSNVKHKTDTWVPGVAPSQGHLYTTIGARAGQQYRSD